MHNVYIIFVRNYERVVQVVIQSEEAVGNNMLNLKKMQCQYSALIVFYPIKPRLDEPSGHLRKMRDEFNAC